MMTWDQGSEPTQDIVSFARQLREAYRKPVGTQDSPYVVVVPKWFEALCAEQGTTPQRLYDQQFAGSSFRHGRVEVVVD